MTDAHPLATLRDIHLPGGDEGAALRLLAAVLAIVLTAAACWAWHQRHTLRALLRLRRLARHHRDDAAALVSHAGRLLRERAQATDPDTGVNRLTGEAWLAYLDRRAGGGRAFRNGPGAALTTLPYAARGGCDTALLLRLVRGWVWRNRR